MQVLRTAAMAAGLSLHFQAMAASAQIDDGDLDDDSPLTAEDPYPAETHTCEFPAPHPCEADSAFRLKATSIVVTNEDEKV
jgi:hypothetical protein